MSNEEIKICACHERQVPLLWTFKFTGAEYWCPACGYTGGMFGAGENVPATEHLKKELIEWKAKSEDFLSGETDQWNYVL